MRRLLFEKFNRFYRSDGRRVENSAGAAGDSAKVSAGDSAGAAVGAKKNRGFILVYTVMIMTFVVTLIGAAVSMLQSTVSLSRKVSDKYTQDAAFYQIEEYIAVGRYATANDYALDNGFSLEILSETDDYGANISKLTVYQGSRVRLYIEQRNGSVVKYIYGEDKTS